MKITKTNELPDWLYFIFIPIVWSITFVSYSINLGLKVGAVFCLIIIIAFIIRYFFFAETIKISFFEIFMVSINSYIILQLLQTYRYWGDLSINLDRVWKYETLLWGVHLFFSFFILLSNYRQKIKLVFGAIYCTSIIFLPISFTPEGSVPFQTPIFLTIFLLIAAIQSKRKSLFTRLQKTWLLNLLLFLIFSVISVFFSYNSGDSLLWLIKLIVVLISLFSVSEIIENWQEWRQILYFTLFVNLIPLLIASITKFLQISLQVDLINAFTNRLNLLEFGRANLIVREMMISIPILISIRINANLKFLRSLYMGLIFVSFLFFGFSQSWGGLIGTFFVILFFFLFYRRGLLIDFFSLNSKKHIKIPVILILSTGILAVGALLASRLNIGTFNGRLFQFRASILQIKDHLITGLGPSVYHLKAVYANKVSWVADTTLTINNPLLPIRWYQDSSTYHAHNLFLEIGVGSGVFALASFIFFLFFLIRYGINLQKHYELTDKDKVYFGGLLLSLIAAIGWGFLDVMQTLPPFFATSIWVYTSLLITIERLIIKNNFSFSNEYIQKMSQVQKMIIVFVFFIISVTLISFSIGNNYYRKAFQSSQMQDWQVAENNLQKASLWEPLNAKYHQLRAEALINIGDYAGAEDAYERALLLKSKFAPYERQLGWLAWLRGDLQKAEVHFNNAITEDPNNAWSDDLYNNLALLKITQGDYVTAAQLFANQFTVTPDLPVSPIWTFYLADNGKKYIYPDMNLVENNVGSMAFQNSIFIQLKKANFNQDLLVKRIPDLETLPISFDQVFINLEKIYDEIPSSNVHDKRVMLATLVQTAEKMGLVNKTRDYALIFISDYPNSVFGYQKMAAIEYGVGNFIGAEDWLEEALQVSRNEKNTLLQLAEIYTSSGNWDKFNAVYLILEKNFPLDADIYRVKYRVENLNGNINGQIDALKHIVELRANLSDYLDLYDLLKASDSVGVAKKYCTQALGKSLISNPPLFSGEAARIGQCLADIYGEKFENKLFQISYQNPRLVSVIAFFGWRTLGETERETEISQTLLLQYPEQWESYYLNSILMKDNGKSALEEQKLLEAINKDPIQLLPRLTLGELYKDQNREKDAIRLYEDAILRISSSREILLNLADAEMTLGDSLSASNNLSKIKMINDKLPFGQIYSFWTNLPNAEIEAPTNKYIHSDFIETYANKSLTIFMHPESSAEYLLNLPEIKKDQTIWLTFSIGMLPQSWLMEGDGVQFVVNLISDGESNTIFESYIDPKQNLDDRYWHPMILDLTEHQGTTISIVLKTEAGPNNDNRFDWAGWGDPAIIVIDNLSYVP